MRYPRIGTIILKLESPFFVQGPSFWVSVLFPVWMGAVLIEGGGEEVFGWVFVEGIQTKGSLYRKLNYREESHEISAVEVVFLNSYCLMFF